MAILSASGPEREARLAGEGQVVGLAHVEVEMDRIERDHGCQQGRWTAGVAAAGDQAADRNLMRADAARERCDDPAVLEVEPRVADLGVGVIDRGLCRADLRRALVDILGRAEIGALERSRTTELAVGEGEARLRCRELGVRLGQPDLVGGGIDHEQQIALLDDLAVHEMDLGQRAADLRAQLDAVDRRELAQQTDLGVDVACERPAYRYRRRRNGRLCRRRGCSLPELERRRTGDQRHQCEASHPKPSRSRRSGLPGQFIGIRPFAHIVHLAAPFVQLVQTPAGGWSDPQRACVAPLEPRQS